MILYIAISIGFLFLVREIVMWYWKINQIVSILQETAEESKKQTEYQKAIYKKIKVIMISQGINEEEVLKINSDDKESVS